MLDELLRQLDPPAAFARTGAPFWDDEHISAGMLAAHLDPGFDGASRGPAFMDRSAKWISEVMPPARFPRLADFGCGPGLYTTRFARQGYRVTGLDLSRRSIAFARQQAAGGGLDITYRVQDYLAMQDAAAWDAAVMIYCDYGALSPDERAAVLRNIHRALAPGGRLVLDVFTTARLEAFREEKWWQASPKGGFWRAGAYLSLHNNLKYPGRVSLEQTVVLEESGLTSYCIWNQYFTLETLAAEAQAAGFKVLQTAGDAAGAPWREDSQTLAVVLERG